MMKSMNRTLSEAILPCAAAQETGGELGECERERGVEHSDHYKTSTARLAVCYQRATKPGFDLIKLHWSVRCSIRLSLFVKLGVSITVTKVAGRAVCECLVLDDPGWHSAHPPQRCHD